MKHHSALFSALFKAKYHGGSYYDRLKVGRPNEYDLDIILTLPKMVNPVLICGDSPGFVQVKLENLENILQKSAKVQEKFKDLDTLLASKTFLSTIKVQSWFERVFAMVYNGFSKKGNETYLDVTLNPRKRGDVTKIFIKMIKEGPAFTLKITGKETDNSDIQLDIDLVPCFWFDGNQHWPKESDGYHANLISTKSSFLVVPKKPRDETMDKSLLERYWRFSFQEQERELIGKDKKCLKPSLKILKKLRDRCNHNIPSYFIKTIFLRAVDKEDVKFWSQPVIFVIINMLKKYEKHIREGKIPYYWNESYNLINYMNEPTTRGIANQLQKIISEIHIGLKDSIDPYAVVKHFLTTEEFDRLKFDVPLSKNQKKRIQKSKIRRALDNLSLPTDSPDSAPPLLQLDFTSSDVAYIQKYLNAYDKRQNHNYRKEMVQIQSTTRENAEDNEIVAYVKKIENKLDKVVNRFEKSFEEGRAMSLRLQRLEKSMTALKINNGSLRGQVRDGESIEDLLSIHQVDREQ
ncbi:cyclic GMP-AMP synthase-like receptor isoform X2 [Euwallacea fornicatus]